MHLPEPSGSWKQSCRSLDPPPSTPETARLGFHWQPWRPSWWPDHSWVKPCHRREEEEEEEEEDVPECSLGATITTEGGIITGDLRSQKRRYHDTQHNHNKLNLKIAALRYQCVDFSAALCLSASAWPDSSYDRHAGNRTITESDDSDETIRESPAALWTSDRAVKWLLEYLRRPEEIPAGPPDVTLITQTSPLTSGGQQRLGVNFPGWRLIVLCYAFGSQAKSALLTLLVLMKKYIYILFQMKIAGGQL